MTEDPTYTSSANSLQSLIRLIDAIRDRGLSPPPAPDFFAILKRLETSSTCLVTFLNIYYAHFGQESRVRSGQVTRSFAPNSEETGLELKLRNWSFAVTIVHLSSRLGEGNTICYHVYFLLKIIGQKPYPRRRKNFSLDDLCWPQYRIHSKSVVLWTVYTTPFTVCRYVHQ